MKLYAPNPCLPNAMQNHYQACKTNENTVSLAVLDINECTTKTYTCDVNAVCKNTQGSYNCTCRDGFHGDGKYCFGNYKI